MSEDESIPKEDREAMVAGMIALHSEIQAEITKNPLDPVRLMRLQGAALNQCLIALAAMLSPGALAGYKPIGDPIP